MHPLLSLRSVRPPLPPAPLLKVGNNGFLQDDKCRHYTEISIMRAGSRSVLYESRIVPFQTGVKTIFLIKKNHLLTILFDKNDVLLPSNSKNDVLLLSNSI